MLAMPMPLRMTGNQAQQSLVQAQQTSFLLRMLRIALRVIALKKSIVSTMLRMLRMLRLLRGRGPATVTPPAAIVSRSWGSYPPASPSAKSAHRHWGRPATRSTIS